MSTRPAVIDLPRSGLRAVCDGDPAGRYVSWVVEIGDERTGRYAIGGLSSRPLNDEWCLANRDRCEVWVAGREGFDPANVAVFSAAVTRLDALLWGLCRAVEAANPPSAPQAQPAVAPGASPPTSGTSMSADAP